MERSSVGGGQNLAAVTRHWLKLPKPHILIYKLEVGWYMLIMELDSSWDW
jgi:hypothetical protein